MRSSDSSQLSDCRYRSVYRSLYTGVLDRILGNWNGKDKEEDIRRKETLTKGRRSGRTENGT